ncbi:uncharacterized protein V1510DRAFT_416197 [Dipodascopsis tothii]|uniref:uncharacterized protein n=1 Tax=Dipodascopsis tothii TaxID=44089 RepID=UPI0034CDE55B
MTDLGRRLIEEEEDMFVPPMVAQLPAFARGKTGFAKFAENCQYYYGQMTRTQKILAYATLALCGVGLILFAVFHRQIFALFGPFLESWRTMRFGSVILVLLMTVTSFPPFIGYTTVVTIAGILYGVWYGWLISAVTTVVASYLCFIVCRRYFVEAANRLAERNEVFSALSYTLQYDGMKLLWMIRMSPLSFSLSNTVLSSIHTVTPRNFVLATLWSTPKLFIHTFIGSRLSYIGDEHMDRTSVILNYISILAGVFFAAVSGWAIYKRTARRVEQIREEHSRLQRMGGEF